MARDRQVGKGIGPAWAGPVPADWDVVRLKHLSTIYSGGTPDRENKDYWDDGAVPWLNSGEVNQWLITEPSTFITEEGFRHSSAKWIPIGALVMALAGQGKTKGMVAQLAIASTCNQSMAAIVPSERIRARFVQWWLHANYETIRNLAGGEQRDGLNLEIVGNIPCPQPPAALQHAIAEYVDRETARLDALVVAKERVLALLAEKRRALISRAVTRGLDPRAPLRASGILWLGEIPAHWEVKRLRHISPFITVGVVVNPSSYVTPDGVPFLYGSDVTEEGINLDSVRRIPLEVSRGELAKTCLKSGDIVTVRVGAPGITAVVPPELDGANCASIMLTRGALSFDSQWLAYAMNSSVGRHQVGLVQYGAAQEQFNISHALDFWFAVPPLDEQRKIVSHIGKATAALDAVRAATTRTIDLLKERRAALVAAAVTGQIDVESVA